MNVGIIGFGKMGQIRAHSIEQSGKAKVKAIYEINYLPKDKLMPDRGTLSVQKAIDMIGYKPEYPIDKGYLDYIKWYKEIKINKMR